MTEAGRGRLRALLDAYAKRAAKAAAPGKAHARGETQRKACGDRLRTLVLPLLDLLRTELLNAGHEASTRDQTDRANAYPSVALSFTPRAGAAPGPQFALASALIFRYDPRHGVVVHADVKASPVARRASTASGERLGTIGVDALSAEWVETKTLNFVEAVLKAN
jgi:hypothetical protein